MSSIATVEGRQRETLSSDRSAVRVPFAVSYSPLWALSLFCVDLALFITSAFLANLLAERVWHTPPFPKQVTGAAVIITLWIVMFRLLGLYHRTYAFRVRDELYYTFAALCLGALPQLVVFTIVPSISTSRVGALLTLLISMLFVGSGRAVMHGVRHLRVFNRNTRIAFVGTPTRIHEAVASMDKPPNQPPLLIEVDDVDVTLRGGDGYALDAIEQTAWFCRAVDSQCGTIVFTEMIDPRVMPQLLAVSARHHIRVAFAPPRIKRHSFSLTLETNGNQALIFASQLNACSPTAHLAKRALDLVAGSLALIAFSPIMLLCAAAIYLESGGPIFYRQERIGVNGRPFMMVKFRSMRPDAEAHTGAIWVRANDDRRTIVGAILRRLSFDELPQLFNVLRGDMSLVGPRPERPVLVSQFRASLPRYDERHLVPPGITGWSQIHMRRLLVESDVAEKLEYDLRYLEQWTIWLDVSILFKTAAEFLFHKPG